MHWPTAPPGIRTRRALALLAPWPPPTNDRAPAGGAAGPCPKRWSELEGEGPERACSACGRRVRDLSQLTRAEARAFLQVRRTDPEGNGSVCATFLRRADGSPWFRGERFLPAGLPARLAASLMAAAGLAACASDLERTDAGARPVCETGEEAGEENSEATARDHGLSEEQLENLRYLGYFAD